MAVRGLFTGDLNDVSFLNLLFLVRAHGSINTLFSIENGAQENMIEGGAGSIARRVADALHEPVRLRAAVRTITQHDDHVVVEADAVAVTARHVVVTVPPALALGITFDPVLPDDRLALYRSAVAGTGDQDAGRVRRAVLAGRRLQRADRGAAIGRGGDARRVTREREARRHRVVHVRAGCRTTRRARIPPNAGGRCSTRSPARLGSRAATPVDFIETAWWNEEWTRGCSMAHFPPGILTRYGPLLREPFDRVHWAGTETATTSYGAIDGAVRSGRRAAAEILDRT